MSSLARRHGQMKTCVQPSGQKWFSVRFSGWNYLHPTYCKNALKRCSPGWNPLASWWIFKILKYVKRDQTFLGLNLAKMGLNFEAPAHPCHPQEPQTGMLICKPMVTTRCSSIHFLCWLLSDLCDLRWWSNSNEKQGSRFVHAAIK